MNPGTSREHVVVRDETMLSTQQKQWAEEVLAKGVDKTAPARWRLLSSSKTVCPFKVLSLPGNLLPKNLEVIVCWALRMAPCPFRSQLCVCVTVFQASDLLATISQACHESFLGKWAITDKKLCGKYSVYALSSACFVTITWPLIPIWVRSVGVI